MSQNERQLVQGALGRSPDGTAPAKLSSSVPRPMPAACQCTPRCLMGHLYSMYWKSGSLRWLMQPAYVGSRTCALTATRDACSQS